MEISFTDRRELCWKIIEKQNVFGFHHYQTWWKVVWTASEWENVFQFENFNVEVLFHQIWKSPRNRSSERDYIKLKFCFYIHQ